MMHWFGGDTSVTTVPTTRFRQLRRGAAALERVREAYKDFTRKAIRQHIFMAVVRSAIADAGEES